MYSPWSCTDIISSAKFVLIVEKDATFQRLLDDDFCSKLSPCIIITVCFPFFRHHFGWTCKWNLFKRPLKQSSVTSLAFVWIRLKACQMWTAGWWWESFGTRCTSPSSLWWMPTLMVHIICLSEKKNSFTAHTYFAYFHTFYNTWLTFHLRTCVPLSRQMLAPVRCVMVPSLAVISVGVFSSRPDGSVSISLHTSNSFPIAWRDTYVMLYFVLSSVTHLRG